MLTVYVCYGSCVVASLWKDSSFEYNYAVYIIWELVMGYPLSC